MKTRLLMFLMAFGLLMAAPTLSYAQYTDEDLEYGSDGEGGFGPVSLEPTYIVGVLSHVNKTITNTFIEDFGMVKIWIVDEQGVLFISEEVRAAAGASVKIDLKSLPEGEYKIICFLPEGRQAARFEMYD